MILIVVDPLPSDLLAENDEQSPITDLVRRALSFLKDGHFREAESAAQMALTAAYKRRQSHPSDLAVASLCLSDIYRETGHLDSALPIALQAYEMFQRQPNPFQRHNEGVAAYNLGLIYHVLENHTSALRWYEVAGQKFRESRRYWLAHHREHRAKECARMTERVVALSKAITDLALLIRPTLFFSIYAKGRFFRHVEPDRFYLDEQIEIDGKSFQVMPLSGTKQAVLERDSPVCLALPIPAPVCPKWKAQTGDYVLAQQRSTPDPDAPRWIVVGQDQVHFGQFARQPDDSLHFHSLHPTRIIGGTGDFSGYYRPVAFLKPI